MFNAAEDRYNSWVRDHYRFLLRSAWVLTGSRALAEDVAQDTFASAWRYRAQLKSAESARPWLFQIMRRHAFRYNTPTALVFETLEDGIASASSQQADVTDGLESDNRLDITSALSRIAPIHREVLVLYYFDDMSTQHMAQALDIAPGTVLSRLARARDVLKAALQPASKGVSETISATITPLRKV